MPETTDTRVEAEKRELDRRLLLSLMLAPAAAGIHTIVGFTVAHWITDVGYKRSGYFVSISCFLLCAIAAWLADIVRRTVAHPDESSPNAGRQLFMAKLSLLVAGLCTLVVVAGTLTLLILGPSD